MDKFVILVSFRVSFNLKVVFSAQYYPARPYKIWEFYDRNMSKASVPWAGWSDYNITAMSKWEQVGFIPNFPSEFSTFRSHQTPTPLDSIPISIFGRSAIVSSLVLRHPTGSDTNSTYGLKMCPELHEFAILGSNAAKVQAVPVHRGERHLLSASTLNDSNFDGHPREERPWRYHLGIVFRYELWGAEILSGAYMLQFEVPDLSRPIDPNHSLTRIIICLFTSMSLYALCIEAAE